MSDFVHSVCGKRHEPFGDCPALPPKDEGKQTLEQITKALKDLVVYAAPDGEQDGGFIGFYVIPTGPMHRAIALLGDVRPMGDVSVISQYQAHLNSQLREFGEKEVRFTTHVKNNRVQALDADHISITNSGVSFGQTKPPYERVVIEYDQKNKLIRFHEPSPAEYGISYKVGQNPASKSYQFRARPFMGILPSGYYVKVADNTYQYGELLDNRKDKRWT